MAKIDLNTIPFQWLEDPDTLRALACIRELDGEVDVFGSIVVKGVEPNDLDLFFAPTEFKVSKEDKGKSHGLKPSHHDDFVDAGFTKRNDPSYDVMGYRFTGYKLGRVEVFSPSSPGSMDDVPIIREALREFRATPRNNPGRSVMQTKSGRALVMYYEKEIAWLKAKIKELEG